MFFGAVWESVESSSVVSSGSATASEARMRKKAVARMVGELSGGRRGEVWSGGEGRIRYRAEVLVST